MSDGAKTEVFSLEALRSGDRTEFARLLEAYSGQIYRLGMKMLNNPQDAEDVLQETFIKAFNNIDRFEGRSKISTWLYRIASNEALMLLRKRKVQILSVDEPLIGDDDPAESPQEIVDWCCLPEDELMSTESQAVLDRSVSQLPESLRVVFLLRDIEGLSTRETAEVLEMTETAVKTRLSRARMRLRELLSTYYSERMQQAGD